jgi:hypothetical protein
MNYKIPSDMNEKDLLSWIDRQAKKKAKEMYKKYQKKNSNPPKPK